MKFYKTMRRARRRCGLITNRLASLVRNLPTQQGGNFHREGDEVDIDCPQSDPEGERQRLIDALARRWTDLRYGSLVDSHPERQAIADYMRDWLAQHGSLPKGEHKVRGTDPAKWPDGRAMYVDFDRLQSDPSYPEGIMQEYRRRLLYTFQPGDRAVFDDYKDRARYGLRGTVVESSGVTHGWAVVDLDNGDKGVRVDGGTTLKKIGKPPS